MNDIEINNESRKIDFPLVVLRLLYQFMATEHKLDLQTPYSANIQRLRYQLEYYHCLLIDCTRISKQTRFIINVSVEIIL